MNLNIQRFWKKRSVTITEYDPTYKVTYLGNVLTAWAKGEGCVDKPLATLWKNYCQNVKPDVGMKVTVGTSGLKAVTKEHGLTEYWSNRVTYCAAHVQYPRVFCWVYRHEGKRLRQELRCHAVLCHKEEQARRMAAQLQQKLALALQEFKREKICRQNARLSLANCVYDNPSLPRRKILLSTGSINYRPPLERSKTAPKLMAIEEAGETLHNHQHEPSPFKKRGVRRRQTYPPSSSSSTSIEEFCVIKEEEDLEEPDEVLIMINRMELEDDVIGEDTRSNSSDHYRNFVLREHYQLQQRRQRLLATPIHLCFDRYGEEERDAVGNGDQEDGGDHVTDLEEVRQLLVETDMCSTVDRLNEDDNVSNVALVEDYDNMVANTFTCNPRAGSSARSEEGSSVDGRRHSSHGSVANDGFDTSTSPSSSSETSSTTSSPSSSVRDGCNVGRIARRGDTMTTMSVLGCSSADDDNVSDESGYSEDNLQPGNSGQQRHRTVTRTFTCDI